MLQNNRKRNFLDCILHLGSSFFQFFKRVGVFVQIMVYLFCNVHLLKSFCKFASHGLFKILVNSLARNERQLNPSSFSTFVRYKTNILLLRLNSKMWRGKQLGKKVMESNREFWNSNFIIQKWKYTKTTFILWESGFNLRLFCVQ